MRSIDVCVRDLHALSTETKQSLEENTQKLETMSQAQTAHFERAGMWMDDRDARKRLEERKAVLDWITPLDYAPQHNDFLEKRQAGTGKCEYLLSGKRIVGSHSQGYWNCLNTKPGLPVKTAPYSAKASPAVARQCSLQLSSRTCSFVLREAAQTPELHTSISTSDDSSSRIPDSCFPAY
jgi:hypothetical protein